MELPVPAETRIQVLNGPEGNQFCGTVSTHRVARITVYRGRRDATLDISQYVCRSQDPWTWSYSASWTAYIPRLFASMVCLPWASLSMIQRASLFQAQFNEWYCLWYCETVSGIRSRHTPTIQINLKSASFIIPPLIWARSNSVTRALKLVKRMQPVHR